MLVASPKSRKKSKEDKSVGGGKGKKLEAEMSSHEEQPPPPPPPQPGDDDWVFVERPIDLVRYSAFLLFVLVISVIASLKSLLC